MPLTRSVEDYLKTIYLLAPSGGAVSTNDIAERLGLSAPSVSGMVKRLSDARLLDHEPYRGVVLTDAGRRSARRNRITLGMSLPERAGISPKSVSADSRILVSAMAWARTAVSGLPARPQSPTWMAS